MTACIRPVFARQNASISAAEPSPGSRGTVSAIGAQLRQSSTPLIGPQRERLPVTCDRPALRRRPTAARRIKPG